MRSVQFGAKAPLQQGEAAARPSQKPSLWRRVLRWFTQPLAWMRQSFQKLARWTLSPLRQLSRPFEKACFSKRLYNAYDNALGVPRIRKPIKAMAWAAATFLVGCIPPFHPLIFATPITFMTTLLVDWFVGFAEGLSANPDKMRQELDLRRRLATDPPNQPASPHD